MVEQTHHSLSETLHCQDYVTSHMYSVEVLDASAASCRTLAGGVKSAARTQFKEEPRCDLFLFGLE
jgi:hypothetical protein